MIEVLDRALVSGETENRPGARLYARRSVLDLQCVGPDRRELYARKPLIQLLQELLGWAQGRSRCLSGNAHL